MLFPFLFYACHSLTLINKTCTDDDHLYTCSDLLICQNNQSCQFCSNHQQCQRYHHNFYCRYSEQYDGKICVYEPILHKFDVKKIIATVLIFICGILISFSGTDGGCIYIPILIALFKTPFPYAASISSSLLNGIYFISFISNLFKKHSFYQRPLINYGVAAIFEPLSWIGIVLGVGLNSIMPNWLFYILNICIILYFSLYHIIIGVKKTVTKYRTQYLFSEADLISFPSSYIGPAYSLILYLIFFHSWIIFMIFPFLRGGNRFQSLTTLPMCSLSYWLLTGLPILYYLGIVTVAIKNVREYPVFGQSASRSFKHFLSIVFFSLLSGTLSGLLGYSGEFIKGPLLATIYLNPDESRVTSEAMMFFTTTITCVHYLGNGILNYRDYFILFAYGLLSSLFGPCLYKRYKPLIDKGAWKIITGTVFAIGFATLVYFGCKAFIYTQLHNQWLGFCDYCLFKNDGFTIN